MRKFQDSRSGLREGKFGDLGFFGLQLSEGVDLLQSLVMVHSSPQ